MTVSSPGYYSQSKRESQPRNGPYFTTNQVSAQGTSLLDIGQPAGLSSYLACFAVFFEHKFPAGPEKSVCHRMSVSAKLIEIAVGHLLLRCTEHLRLTSINSLLLFCYKYMGG